MKSESRRLVVVAHGSRSPKWVAAQREWFAGVARELGPLAESAELTFLEISAPLFEDRLRELVQTDTAISVLPFFLSKAGHASEDVPRIADEVLGPGRWELVEPTGWSALLGANCARRLRECGTIPGEPIIVSGYGASHHQAEWNALIADVQAHAGEYAGGPPWPLAPSGHFLEDYAAPLRECLAEVAAQGLPSAAVLPLYLAVSSYQESLIPGVIAEFPGLAIRFRPTSILPDQELERWGARLIAQALQPAPEPIA